MAIIFISSFVSCGKSDEEAGEEQPSDNMKIPQVVIDNIKRVFPGKRLVKMEYEGYPKITWKYSGIYLTEGIIQPAEKAWVRYLLTWESIGISIAMDITYEDVSYHESGRAEFGTDGRVKSITINLPKATEDIKVVSNRYYSNERITREEYKWGDEDWNITNVRWTSSGNMIYLDDAVMQYGSADKIGLVHYSSPELNDLYMDEMLFYTGVCGKGNNNLITSITQGTRKAHYDYSYDKDGYPIQCSMLSESYNNKGELRSSSTSVLHLTYTE